MLLSEIMERFAKHGPVPLMARIAMVNAFAAGKLDELFRRKAEHQYTRELLFSTVVDLMVPVVCGMRPSVHAAYQASTEEIGVSITSVYNKLNGLEPGVSGALVRETAGRLATAIRSRGGRLPSRLPGYRTKILDGNCIAATEHRLAVLRETAAGPLPGKSLVVFEPDVGLVTDVFPCEDGHAQERSLLEQVLETVEAGTLWIADRNFCTLAFLRGIAKKNAYFVIRQPAAVAGFAVGRRSRWVRVEGGEVCERHLRVPDPDPPEAVSFFRQIVMRLDQPTRDGETRITILTNLPAEAADATTLAVLYRGRWTLETVFQVLTEALCCEIESLGYPRAALFGFCVALAAFNLLATVQAALRSVHGVDKIEKEVSRYYLADEIAGSQRGMLIAIPKREWTKFQDISPEELGTHLQRMARHVNLRLFRKHPRGPKKPQPPRTNDKGKPQVSTAKLLNAKSRSP